MADIRMCLLIDVDASLPGWHECAHMPAEAVAQQCDGFSGEEQTTSLVVLKPFVSGCRKLPQCLCGSTACRASPGSFQTSITCMMQPHLVKHLCSSQHWQRVMPLQFG